jgi:transcription antitermination protein NusB
VAARSKARRRALDVLFEADVRGIPASEVLTGVKGRRAAGGEPPLNPYTEELVSGVVEHRQRIDDRIASLSIGWTLERMPAVDRNILRIGAFEVLYGGGQVPAGVTVAEAVQLATELSTDESPRFINGLLSRLAGLQASAEGDSGPADRA